LPDDSGKGPNYTLNCMFLMQLFKEMRVILDWALFSSGRKSSQGCKYARPKEVRPGAFHLLGKTRADPGSILLVFRQSFRNQLVIDVDAVEVDLGQVTTVLPFFILDGLDHHLLIDQSLP